MIVSFINKPRIYQRQYDRTHFIMLSLFLLLGTVCLAQNTEFGRTNNGLIYSDSTIKQLRFIVDSLNLKFRRCELNKKYVSKSQAKAHYIFLQNVVIDSVKKDLEAKISFDDFVRKYNDAKVEKNLLIVKFDIKNYYKKNSVRISSIGLSDKYEHSLNFADSSYDHNQLLKGKWLYKHNNKFIEAFYFLEEFTQMPLPDIYARMIQYSNCMVDTSAQIFYEETNRTSQKSNNDETSKLEEFMDYIHKSTGQPDYSKEEYETFYKKYRIWDSLRVFRVDSLKKYDEKFNKLFNVALEEAIKKGGTDDEFEEYVGRYFSRKTELQLKRNRRVIGQCSQDEGPRVHAFNIAKLAAETVNWEIFLRAHLDIMNDRFVRATDGSYAWKKRKTYIKELEVLDIDVFDLLLGISLQIGNPSANHYFGSIGRLGKALSETGKASEIEEKILQMISDKQLDDYNRVLMYYLFLNYNYNLESIVTQTVNKKRLVEAIKSLPDYIATKIMDEK